MELNPFGFTPSKTIGNLTNAIGMFIAFASFIILIEAYYAFVLNKPGPVFSAISGAWNRSGGRR